MIRAIAIETSARLGSVALAVDGATVATDVFPHGFRHAAEIVPRLDALCRRLGWRPADVDEVYVSTGPGSFTGLRIGVTLAKAFALGTGARLVAVPTLLVLARNAPPNARHACVAWDAKRGQVYAGRLTRAVDGGPWEVAEPPRLDTLAAALARCPRPVVLIGEGIAAHRADVPTDDPAVTVAPPEAAIARAEVVAALGHESARAGHAADPDTLVPVYMRIPEAEEKWAAAENQARETSPEGAEAP